MKKAPIILSLGGSLIFPKTGIDVPFLRAFKAMIERRVKKGDRFIIICGGGAICRSYQEASAAVGAGERVRLDWLGVQVTQVNAALIRNIFGDLCHDTVVTNPAGAKNWSLPIMAAAGWRPGRSTDFNAVLHAARFKAARVFNLTNTDYVYDKDPNKFKDAKPIKRLTWKEFRKLIGSKWGAGWHAPFDPIASRRASQIGLEVASINGKNMKNFEAAIAGKKFVGTVIAP